MRLRDIPTRLGTWLYRNIAPLTVIALVVLFFVLLFADRILKTVPAGHVGVLWRRLAQGTVVDRIYGEGLQMIWPWNLMTVYPIRFQQIERDFTAIDKNGLRFDLRVSTRFRLNRERVGLLHQHIGPKYVDVVVVPDVAAYTLSVVSQYSAEEVYATKRVEVQKEIRERVREGVVVRVDADDFIDIEDVLVRQITLPPIVALAIEEKNRQLQLDQEWMYRIAREKKERERKEIEGEGIQRFQAKVGGKISEGYLRWKGIDATLKLAESANAKVVIIGAGPQGLPVMLGNDFSSPTAPTARQRADAPAEIQPSRSEGGNGVRPAEEAAARTTGAESALAGRPASAPTPSAAKTGPAGNTVEQSGPETKATEPKAPAAGGIRGFISRLLDFGR